MILVLAFLSALALSNAFPVPSPGKELIYDYSARIRVGTNEPLSFASQFILDGKLHLQRENQNSTLLRFTDLTFKLYNGILNRRNEFESKSLPLPQETSDLLRIFRIEYDEDGKLSQLITEAGEQKYVKNIKKAIASLLQLDRKNLQLNNETPSRRAFITQERNLYGHGVVEYNVEFQGNQILVQKMQDIESLQQWYANSDINIDPVLTGQLKNSPFSANSLKLYTLVKNNDGDIDINKLETKGSMYVHMLKGLMDTQYISVNQTLNLIETIPIENVFRINNEERTELEFKLETENQSGAIADLTFGRHTATQEQITRLVQRALEDAMIYLETNQLTLEAPDVRKAQAINRLQQLLGNLDLQTLEQVNTNLEGKTGERDKQILKIFQEILPLIGSRASIVLIKNLVLKNKLNEELLIDMLNKMPLNLRLPSEKLLQEVEILADLGNEINLNIRKAGVLSFASLVNKVYANRLPQDQQNIGRYARMFRIRQNDNINRVNRNRNLGGEDNTLLDQYIKKFLNRLQDAQDYPTQLLNLQALNNIQVKVNRYLEKYVRGEGVNPRIQFWAMCASMNEDLKDPAPERIYEVYWPIFTNRKLHLELRATAYFIIMSSPMTMGKLWSIYWVLQSEQNPELYNFVYTNLKSLSESRNPLLREKQIIAAQILRFIRKPLKNYLSGNYIFDYEDPKYEFGVTMQNMVISTRTSKSLYIDLSSNIMGVPVQLQSLYLNIDGLDPTLADRLPKEKIIRMNNVELEELVKIIMTLLENKNIRIEYALLTQNQVVRLGYFDNSNIGELTQQLEDCIQNIQELGFKWLKNSLQIKYNVLSQIVLPNDLGMPTILQIKSPKLINNLINIVRTDVNKIMNIQGDIKLQTSIQTVIDVGIYNPIADIWQGIQRINSYDQIIPLNLNLAINSPQNSIKLTMNMIEDQQKGSIGLRNYVRNQVYVIGDEINNFLGKSSSQSKAIQEVTRGKQTKRTTELLNLEDENTGLRYEVLVFDNEKQISQNNVAELLNLILRRDSTNNQEQPLLGLLLSLRNIWARIFMCPGVGTSGLLIRAVPSTVNRISQIDLSLRLNQETIQPGTTKINSRATYSLKQPGDKVLKTLDINTILEMNTGNTVNNLKVQISRIIPDQKDYRICIDGIKKYDQNGVTGHLSIASGQSVDNKCVKDEILIDINMKGEISKEQGNNNNNQQELNDECSLTNSYDPLTGNEQQLSTLPFSCIQRDTTIRNYEYDIKTTRMPQQMTNVLELLQRIAKELLILNISQYQLVRSTPIEENNIKVIAKYAPNDKEINLLVIRPKETYKISGVHVPQIIGLLPDNYEFSQKFLLLNKKGLIDLCVLNQQGMLNINGNVIDSDNISGNQNEWIVYVRDRNVDAKFNIAIRKLAEQQNRLGLRIVSQDNSLEVLPNGNKNQLILNGQALPTEGGTIQENWVNSRNYNDNLPFQVINLPNYNLVIIYNGQSVQLYIPKLMSSLEGKCSGA